jgi:hypothetical protein
MWESKKDKRRKMKGEMKIKRAKHMRGGGGERKQERMKGKYEHISGGRGMDEKYESSPKYVTKSHFNDAHNVKT